MRRAILFVAIAAACSRGEPLSPESGSAILMRNLLRAPALELVLPGGAIEAAGRREAARLALERGMTCAVVLPGVRGEPAAARIVVGGPEDAAARALVERLGVRCFEEGGRRAFGWLEETFFYPSDAILAVLPDPDRPGLPLTLVYGNDPASLGGYLEGLEPGWRPWVRMYRRGDLVLSGPLALSGAIAEKRMQRPGDRRARWLGNMLPLAALDPGARPGAVQVARGIDPALAREYLAAVARARKQAAAWAAEGADASEVGLPPALFLHARAESLAAAAGPAPAGLSALNPVSGAVHALVSSEIPHDAGLAAARELAHARLGRPAAGWLEDGAAAHAASSWFGRDLESWVAWLRDGGLAPGVADLVDPLARDRFSRHLLAPLRGVLFGFLLEERGAGWMRELWKGDRRLAPDEALERGFAARLDALRERGRASIEAARASRRDALTRAGTVRGVGMEEPARDGERGFGSFAFEESLAQAHGIGADSVALSCYAADDPGPPGPDPWRTPGFAPLEGDLRLFSALCVARARGFRTLLQPRLLAAPTGTLAGAGAQPDPAGWTRLFDGIERSSVHFGLLAELARADGLSLGGGTIAATRARDTGRRGRPEIDALRIAGWERVIRSTRGAFAGTLTCAAGTLIEAKELAFWRSLDAVACDQTEELDDRAVTGRKDPVEDLAVRLATHVTELGNIARDAGGKPLLLTGAGFGAAPRVSGLARPGAGGVDPAVQALEFDVLARTLSGAARAHGLAGVFLWRWSTDPRDEGANARDWLIRSPEAREAAARVLKAP